MAQRLSGHVRERRRFVARSEWHGRNAYLCNASHAVYAAVERSQHCIHEHLWLRLQHEHVLWATAHHRLVHDDIVVVFVIAKVLVVCSPTNDLDLGTNAGTTVVTVQQRRGLPTRRGIDVLPQDGRVGARMGGGVAGSDSHVHDEHSA
jgi:hypothetical protein